MTRLLAWTDEAWSDYIYWQGQDIKTIKRINKLISDSKRSPVTGRNWQTRSLKRKLGWLLVSSY